MRAADTAKGYVGLYPVQSTNSLDKTKSYYSNLAQTTKFTADIAIEGNLDVNSLKVADGNFFAGNAGNNFIKCDSINGDPSDELIFGDLIVLTDDNGLEVSHLVDFATAPVGYSSDRVKAFIYLTTPLVNDVKKAQVTRYRLKSFGNPTNNLLFQLPQDVIATLQSNIKKTQINYFVVQEFIQNVASGATSVTLNTTAANERFIQGNDNIIVSESKIGSGQQQ